MLKWFRADLHIHTCLSPCCDLFMSPRTIVAEALRNRLDIIAITDHNSSENVGAVMRAGCTSGISVLPGMEVCSREEVHVVAVFDALSEAMALQADVYGHLSGRNDPDAFGTQVIANEYDEVEGFEERLLIGAVDLPVDEIVLRIHELGGLAVAAHIDRESFGIIGQLGFIPPSVRFDGLELSPAIGDEEAGRRFSEYPRHLFLRSSDAHSRTQFGRTGTRFLMEQPTCEELRLALRMVGGRRASPEQALPAKE